MTTFVQFHLLTVYPPSNPNRDDTGRPKQALVGGAPRLRLSSQSLKRAIRESAYFESDLAGHKGTRTKRLGIELQKRLIEQGETEDKAREIANAVATVFSKLEAPEKGKLQEPVTTTLAFISPDEWKLAEELAERMRKGESLPKDKELKKLVLRQADGAVDIAMFGRMLADDPDFNRDAAVQVAHAVTVHKAVAEDDFFTAVDDLNRDDAGAGHMGVSEFGAGVYYLYVCIDRMLLAENLGNDEALVQKALTALTTAACTVAPTGKQASYASRAYACFALAEKGDDTPRNLSLAFLKPVGETEEERDGHLGEAAIARLRKTKNNMDKVYGQKLAAQTFNVFAGEGSLAGLAAFVAE